MKQSVGSLLLAFIFMMFMVFGAAYLVWSGVSGLSSLIAGADANVVAAVIAAAGTALTTVFAVLLAQYFSRLREINEAHRERKTEIYKKFLDDVTMILRKHGNENDYDMDKDDNVLEVVFSFQQQILLWASPGVIRTWIKFRLVGNSGGSDILLVMDSLIRAMRRDLGLSNRFLSRGDFVKILLKDPDELDRLLK